MALLTATTTVKPQFIGHFSQKLKEYVKSRNNSLQNFTRPFQFIQLFFAIL